MQDEQHDKIKDFVQEKSGKLLEIKVYNILKKYNFSFRPNIYYDPIIKDYREIDFVAHMLGVHIRPPISKKFPKKEIKKLDPKLGFKPTHFLRFDLIIECKRLPRKSWIFLYDEEKPSITPETSLLVQSSLPFYEKDNPLWPLRAQLWNGIGVFPRKSHILFSRYFWEYPLQKDEREKIFEAISSVKLAADYDINRTKFSPATKVLMPLIVFEGKMLSYNKKTNDLEEINSVYLIENFGSRNDLNQDVKQLIIPIVNIKYFEKFIISLQNLMEKNIKKLAENFSLIYNEYGQNILKNKYPALLFKIADNEKSSRGGFIINPEIVLAKQLPEKETFFRNILNNLNISVIVNHIKIWQAKRKIEKLKLELKKLQKIKKVRMSQDK